ncbi:hypothetical protein GCM10009789_36790 [Kribbella sancticallisti]|uniref:CBS domain-containing protein n=1 Tax=Kribbella sancticallisti TaxID=460087 RepID=A0ABP4PI50_9ACTN
MAEPVVGAVMTRSPVTVPPDAPLKQVACALLVADACAVPVVSGAVPIGVAVRRLSDPTRPGLCVVDDGLELVGLLTRRDLLAVYRRSDEEIAAEVHLAVERDRFRPALEAATLTVEVRGGVVTLEGELAYHSQVDHAGYAASRVAGVIAVHNNLRYDVDDLLVTGF